MKTYSRKIQTSWYAKYPWISVCTSRYKVFCSTCRGAKHLGLTFPKQKTSVFVEEGYCNWSKALQRFQDHEKSEIHKEATEKMAIKSSGINITAQLSVQHKANNLFHQKC